MRAGNRRICSINRIIDSSIFRIRSDGYCLGISICFCRNNRSSYRICPFAQQLNIEYHCIVVRAVSGSTSYLNLYRLCSIIRYNLLTNTLIAFIRDRFKFCPLLCIRSFHRYSQFLSVRCTLCRTPPNSNIKRSGYYRRSNYIATGRACKERHCIACRSHIFFCSGTVSITDLFGHTCSLQINTLPLASDYKSCDCLFIRLSGTDYIPGYSPFFRLILEIGP